MHRIQHRSAAVDLHRVRRDYGLDTISVDLAQVGDGEVPEVPTELRSADLLVTTAFHTADIQRLAGFVQKPWITVVLRVDYVAEVTRLLARGAVYFVVADPRFADRLRTIYGGVAGATNLRPLVVGRDDLAHIPAARRGDLTRETAAVGDGASRVVEQALRAEVLEVVLVERLLVLEVREALGGTGRRFGTGGDGVLHRVASCE